MSTLQLNGKDLATQTSSDEPVIASTVTGGAGLSGMTSLGTVTVGNLSNTAIVYPDGHILQVQGNSGTAADSVGSGNIISQAITLIDYANNDVLITATGAFHKQSGGDAGHLSIYVVGGSLGSTTSGQRYTAQGLYNQGNTHEETVAISHWDKAPPSASETYSIYLYAQGSLVMNTVRFTINVMEIKR